ncbi:GNAT family N-acetyltransferase [Amycolatopsis nigrescens]|uniref:GNAT family N-acetyltransferase n=1 Tax=Amycolatopsis nigrescens TaxID=381445 RepID=UPI0003A546E9|nr:GNAT family N-acetyltransferase [Amycolatopsis nigrescens]
MTEVYKGHIRPVETSELALLPAVEKASDGLFEGVEFPPGSVLDELDATHTVLVAGRPPVGFAVYGPLDDAVHLHQISVVPEHGRRGIGTALLSAIVQESTKSVTLTTFRDVPWNAPWYRKHGFLEFSDADWGPGLRRLVAAERAAGLDRIGPRVVLRRAPGRSA